MTKVNNNRDNLISAIAFIEDISRSSNRVHEMLTNLMNNPGNINSIKSSIDNLHEKITNLKNSDMELPLIEEEAAVVPSIQDISPKQDIGLGIVSAPQPTPDFARSEEEPTPKPKKELKKALLKKPVERIKKNKRLSKESHSPLNRPNKPLSNNRKVPELKKDN